VKSTTMPSIHRSNRRSFLKSSAATLMGTALLPDLMAASASSSGTKLFSSMGIVSTLDKAEPLKAAGADFLTEGVASFLMPDQPEAKFEENLAKLAACPLPVLACNGFIRPPHLRCVGADANHGLVLEWADTTFRRMKRAGGKFIVFGSGASRQLKDGWPKHKADAQFVDLLKRMGPLAEAQGITVTLEQLQAKECNYINHLSEGAELIRAAAHPHIRLLADFYHMAMMDDTPADLKAAMDVVAHIEIAEKNGRCAPGVNGDDFRPFFRVLKEFGYHGAINIEGKWTPEQVAPAFRQIATQAAEA
jgi:sugar phosphate isomerase/epimerase